jgi:hypothetical protein
MTKKIILVFLLASVCTMSGCGFWDWLRSLFSGGGCDVSYCCTYGPQYTPFVAIYPDENWPFQLSRRKGSIGPNGVGTFSKTSPRGTTYPYCSSILVIHGNNFGFGLTASPSTADLNALPSSFTISGQGMDGTYGMPMVEYFDSDGYLLGSTLATAVAGDGSWLTTPTPDLSSAYSGTFQIKVTNLRSDGEYLDIVGSATMSCWGRDRPDSDGDGFYDDEDCYPYDPSLWCGSGGGGGGGGGCINNNEWCNVY